MANKQNFTPDEWLQVLESVMLAGIAVSAADPNGLWGTVKEAYVNSSALRTARHDVASNELIKAALADLETSQGRGDVQKALRTRFAEATPADCVTRSLASLTAVSAILDAKAPQDAPAFKAWLCSVSRQVADASTEGGFLGIGGARVSDAEKATLDDISRCLDA
jgi:hypothetical protein